MWIDRWIDKCIIYIIYIYIYISVYVSENDHFSTYLMFKVLKFTQ